MINENQDNVMAAYLQSLKGKVVNESTEADTTYEEVFENSVAKSTKSILEAYLGSNQEQSEKAKALIQEAAKKIAEEKCEKCGEEPCKCPAVNEEDEDGKDDKKDDKDEVVAESAFQTFMKKRLSEREDAEEMSSEDMLDFFAESEVLWEAVKKAEEECDKPLEEADIKDEESFKKYANEVMKAAHGDDFDQKIVDKMVKDIVDEVDGDWGEAVGRLNS